MCDYSLRGVASRPAKVGDILTTTTFRHTFTRGFAAIGNPDVAVCLSPGTEIAFDGEIRCADKLWPFTRRLNGCLARFRQINLDKPYMHHDAIELPDGQIVLVAHLVRAQQAVVLQLPMSPGEARVVRRAQELGEHHHLVE